MADLIDRQTIIETIHSAIYPYFCGAEDGDALSKDEKLVLSVNKAVCTAIKALPSAQPDVPDTNVGDMISRQAAYEVLTAYYHQKTDIQHAALHDALNRVPAARARWEYVDYGGIGNYHCSRCRAIGKKDYEYCPRCGARMDGE